MAVDLEQLRDDLNASLEELLDERDDAFAAKDNAKVAVAEEQAKRIADVVATLQFAINNQVAINLNAVAKRLEDSIEAQRAIGLSTAAQTIAAAVARLRGDGAGQAGGGGAGAGQAGAGQGGGGAPQGGDIQARPGPNQMVIGKLIAGAKAHRLDPLTILTIVDIECEFKPTATSRLSTAGGLFQFLDATWIAEGGAPVAGHGGVGDGMAAFAPIDEQIDIGCRFTAKNIQTLTAELGSPPSLTATYMAHQQGPAGALRILRADPNAAIESVIGDSAARNNGFAGLSVAATVDKFRTLVRRREDEVLTQVSTVAQPEAGGHAGPVPSHATAGRAVNVALTEMETFARHNGTIVTETQSPLRQRVLEYFRFVDRPDIVDTASEPWSAAFISFVMDRAGASQAQFPKSQNHTKYILAGLANRMANRLDAPVVYFDTDEIVPRVGDLIGFSRTSKVKDRADIEPFLHLPPKDQFFPSHTNLVIDVSPGSVTAIGGNVSQTIKTATAKTDSDGKIVPSDEHFFVLRINI